MAYTKQTWANGDTVTAAKLNHIEDGIADTGSSGGVAVVDCYFDNVMEEYALDATVQEIYDTIEAGTPVFVKYRYGAIPTDYVSYQSLAPVVHIYKYDTVYRVVVSRALHCGNLGGFNNMFQPAVYVFGANYEEDKPQFLRVVYPTSVSASASGF